MAQAKQPITTYTFNWVVGTNRKGILVLTNSSLPVVSCEGNALPCHNSHTHVCCLAQLIRTKTSGTEQFSLRLTSPMLHSDILIHVSFDPSFLDLFIGGKTEVFFPLPNEKPIDYGIITPTDNKEYVVLNNPNLPVVGISIIVENIQMEIINYTPPSNRASEKKKQKDKRNLDFLQKESKTPVFNIENDRTVRRCSLPEKCLITIPCNDGYVPVKCSTKLAWFQTLGSKTSVILMLFSKWLETPVYVQIDTHSSFLDFSSGDTIEVFFPLPIPKKIYNVEVKNHLTNRTDSEKQIVSVQRPNQVWSIDSNEWELIRKPKPRTFDWKWCDSTAGWICPIDPTTGALKKLDRTNFSNCY